MCGANLSAVHGITRLAEIASHLLQVLLNIMQATRTYRVIAFPTELVS